MKTDNNSDYWNERAKVYGHTGWSDLDIYAYDQQVRRLVVKYLVSKQKIEHGSMLDFGGGSGDFSRDFSKLFKHIVLYDISTEVLKIAEKKLNCKNVTFEHDLTGIKKQVQEFDFILSVTVLQSILSDTELQEVLKMFYNILSPGGVIVLLETVTNQTMKTDVTFKSRSCSELISMMEAEKFKLSESYNFYSPINSNVIGCQNYMNSKLHAIVSYLNKFVNTTSVLELIAKHHISDPNDYLSPFDNKSGTKVMIFKK